MKICFFHSGFVLHGGIERVLSIIIRNFCKNENIDICCLSLNKSEPLDFYLLHFTDETPATVAQVLHTYRHGGPNPKQITRGLYRRGVE